MLVVSLSGALAALIWRRKGGTASRGFYLGFTTPVVGVLMAFWMSPDVDETAR